MGLSGHDRLVPCQDNYIELDNFIPSRSGLYADSLPGIDIETIDSLRKNAKDSDETWDLLYGRAWNNLISDVSKNIQDRFFVDSKIVSRETSAFLAEYNSSGLAGVKLTFNLSKYTKIHLLSVSLWSQIVYTNAPIYVYDTDEDGELLDTFTQNLVIGRNTINIDTDYETDLFVAIDTAIYTIKKTETKFYHGMTAHDYLGSILCDFEICGGTGAIQQVNGGGLNLKYVVYCSIEKFVCENLNLFKMAFLWKIGVEITDERRYGERLNRLTIMTVERATELQEYYAKRYELEILDAIKSQNIREDNVCFACKNTVTTQISLP